MSLLVAFTLGFGFSFIGTIPPGTLNLTVLQLGLEHKIKAAWQFSIAAALVEYPYGWIAVTFEKAIMSTPGMLQNFERIGASVMLALGVLNFIGLLRKKSVQKIESKEYGFLKGLLLGVLNPLAIPYWIGITAYINSMEWLKLNTALELHAYLLGIVLGALSFFLIIAYLAKRAASYLQGNSLLLYIPAFTLVVLGIYGLFHSLM